MPALIIQFIKEFEVDVEKSKYDLTAFHHAVLYKLFTIVKFLVEDCKVDVNRTSTHTTGGTALHMAYGIRENIAQYLIEHGTDQDATDGNGSKPKDHGLYGDPKNIYSAISTFFCKERVILKSLLSHENLHYVQLCDQGLTVVEAVDLTFKKSPSL